MAVSQNGYRANVVADTQIYTVTASGRTMRLRKGSTGAMLAHMVRWFDEHIRDVDPGVMDEWGYAARNIRGSSQVSNHASGTAADVDATKWPLGSTASKYLTDAEIAKVHEQLKVYEGCIRWGADYTGRKDPMHFEINRNQATVDRVWAKILAAGGGAAPAPSAPSTPGIQYEARVDAPLGSRILHLGSVGSDVGYVQRWHGLKDDNAYGPVTEAAVKSTQERNHVEVDGRVGPVTWGLMGIGQKAVTAPAPKVYGYAFPLPAGHWFGPASKDVRNHSGYWAADRPHIVELLNMLRRRGWQGVPNTDRYTAEVEQLIRKYQADAHIHVDGGAGRETWESIRTSPVR